MGGEDFILRQNFVGLSERAGWMRNRRRDDCRFCFLASPLAAGPMRRLPVFTGKLLIRACRASDLKTAVVGFTPKHNPAFGEIIPVHRLLFRRVRATLEARPPTTDCWQVGESVARFQCFRACGKQSCNTASSMRKKLSSGHFHLLSLVIPPHTDSIVLSHESSQKYKYEVLFTTILLSARYSKAHNLTAFDHPIGHGLEIRHTIFYRQPEQVRLSCMVGGTVPYQTPHVEDPLP